MAINLGLLKRSFSKAAQTYEQQAYMQNIMAQELCSYLSLALGKADYSLYEDKLSLSSSAKYPLAAHSTESLIANTDTNKKAVLVSGAEAAVADNALQSTALEVGSAKEEAAVFNRVLEIGCGPGNFTKILLHNFKVNELCLNDLSSCMIEKNLASLHSLQKQDPAFNIAISAICGNALELDNTKQELAQPFDILVSNATFQWFHDLESSLKHLAGFVKNQDIALVNSKSKAHVDASASAGTAARSGTRGGRLIAFSSFYEGNFAQIKKLTGVSLNYLTKEQVIRALDNSTIDYQVYFSSHEQYFDSSLSLFRHLKDTGVTALSDVPLTASAFKELLRSYQEQYASPKGVCLTWCPYYVVALI